MIYLLLFLVLIFITSFLSQNDLSIKSKNIKFKKVLVIYPHPDDEVLTCGGLIKSLNKSNIDTTLAVLTKGEAGNNCLNDGSDLKKVRTREMYLSSQILGVHKLIQLDLGDGKLSLQKQIVKYEVEKIINAEKPDLLITYDLTGLYGHPDHIVLSEIVTTLQTRYGYKLWYSTFPKKVLRLVKLPDHMAKDVNYKSKRVYPNTKIFVGMSVISKIKAMYVHKSQYNSFRNAYPFKFIPLWVFVLGTIFEYFYEVK